MEECIFLHLFKSDRRVVKIPRTILDGSIPDLESGGVGSSPTAFS